MMTNANRAVFRVRLARANALSTVDLISELVPKVPPVPPPVAALSGTYSIVSTPADSPARDDAEGPLAIEPLGTRA